MRLRDLARRCRPAVVIVVGALVALTATPGDATIGVTPLGANIPPGESAASFTVNNVDTTDRAVQLEIDRWERSDGRDKLTKSSDWIVNPPVLNIPALGSRVVRMALRRRIPGAPEAAYRLILTEVKGRNADRGLAVAVNMHVSLPIFIEPERVSDARPAWTAKRAPGNRVIVTLNNAASIHVHLQSFLFKDPSGRIEESRVSTYIFSGRNA